MAQFDRKDAQRLKERMQRGKGLYGIAASNVLKHCKYDLTMDEALFAARRKSDAQDSES